MPSIEVAIPSPEEPLLERISSQTPVLELSDDALHKALRDVAIEELGIARKRYEEHRDPVRCAVSISLVLRSLAKDLYGESRIGLLRRVGWLNFLLKTSDADLFRPHVIETMSAALYGDPADVALPSDCGFWFDTADKWIRYQEQIAATHL